MLSVAEKLLLSAYVLESSGRIPFTAENLVVSAWENFPDTFGLSGYRDEEGNLIYPDSNRVFAEIMGSKPVRKKGYIQKVGKKLYQLTESGRSEASRLSVYSDSNARKISLARDIENELQRLMSSRAFVKMNNKSKEDITFFDACSFWSISPRSSSIEFEGKIANLENIIERTKEIVADSNASFIHGGKTFNASNLSSLEELHLYLLGKFEEEIRIIRSRTDERV